MPETCHFLTNTAPEFVKTKNAIQEPNLGINILTLTQNFEAR